MSNYFELKFEALKVRENRKRYATLRDVLLVTLAVELSDYLQTEGISEDIDQVLITGFRRELNIGLNFTDLYQ